MINVLIVEDDPMVAQVNKKFINTLPGFKVEMNAGTVAEAKDILAAFHTIDLILLDVYMPGDNGLELLRYIRKINRKIDCILITAASDKETVEQAIRLGSVDYLIKPFSFERLKKALLEYSAKRAFLQHHGALTQEDLDKQLFSREDKSAVKLLPKGITKSTLKIIHKEITKMDGAPFETDDLAYKTGMSTVSIRKYLKFLEEIKVIQSYVSHGSIGRPSLQFQFRPENENILTNYL